MDISTTEYDNNYLKQILFRSARNLKEKEISVIAETTGALAGIEDMVFLENKVVITYYTHVVTGDHIKETLIEAGYPMTREDRKKKSVVQRFLENIAESNKKARNDKGPACCRL